MLASELAEELGGRLLGADLELNSIRSLQKAGKLDLAVFLRPQDIFEARSTKAGCLLVSMGSAADHTDTLPCALVVVDDVCVGFAQVVDLFCPKTSMVKSGTIIHPSSYIDDAAVIGEECEIGPGVRIIGPVIIGNRVVIGANSVIGSSGFVFSPLNSNQHKRVSAVRGVVIGDDVEIGASCCVDRGILEDTTIEAGVKIDNLVQIAHDVVIGENSVICGQSGLAGYAKVGPRSTLGGQVGVAPYVVLGCDVQVNGKSGVFRDVGDGQIIGGNPALPHLKYLPVHSSR